MKTLTLANGNENQVLLQAWLDEVGRLSAGRLRIRVRSDWRVGDRDFESGGASVAHAGDACNRLEQGQTGNDGVGVVRRVC